MKKGSTLLKNIIDNHYIFFFLNAIIIYTQWQNVQLDEQIKQEM